MNLEDSKYGIFTRNGCMKDISSGTTESALLGHIFMIKDVRPDAQICLLKENLTWDSKTYMLLDNDIEYISTPLLFYIASITSPYERVKLVKNKSLCGKLRTIDKDDTVGFTEANEVRLAKIKFLGSLKGIGHCIGLEFNEKLPNNKCDGSHAGKQYFSCRPGYGYFTTIDRIVPTNYADTRENSLSHRLTELDISLQKNLSGFDNEILNKQHREDIPTKYGEYCRKITTTPTNLNYNMKTSQSLQNIFSEDSVNTTNDFDQNTIIQPDKSHLMNSEKIKNKSEMDLADVIGPWLNSEYTKNVGFTNSRKNLDKNDNINEYKYNNLENRSSMASSNGTLHRSSKSKSSNPFSMLMESNGTTKKSSFYISNPDNISDNTDKYKEVLKKVENSKKINNFHKEHQPKATSTFYVNEQPKYKDPPPGTTNDLVIGSLIEVETDVMEAPLFGVIRWMGFDTEANFTLVGIELEEEAANLPRCLTLTDGVHNNKRLFECPNGKAFFVPLERCHKDSRFQDNIPTPVHQAASNDFEFPECPRVPGAVAPLCVATEEDVEGVCGKSRGIQGHHNSCYLDVTLFSMFMYTGVFDGLLFRPKNSNDIADYEEVQRVLREEIVNPLRKYIFVSANNVMKLRKLLDRLSSVSGLTSEEKDPEEFLNSLLAQILKAEPFLKLNSGQEAFHYQLFVEKDAELTLPTVQQLFEQSFLTSDIKLKEVPSCLIIQMPRFGKNYKMYSRILPSQLLDVTDVIEGSPRQCTVCGKLAQWECRECFSECTSQASLECTAFCTNCLKTAHKHERRQRHKYKELEINTDFLTIQEHCRPPRLYMELFAVICIETSHYVTFVKCGPGHAAPWCFFDSMADRRGEKNGYNIPEMVACPDISQWLSDEKACRELHERCPMDKHLPEHARRLLCDAYICMYQSPDVMMYR